MAAEDYIDFGDIGGGSNLYYDSHGQYHGPTNPEEEWEMDHYGCPGKPVVRTNKVVGSEWYGHKFYGCSEFPKCRKTMQIR